MLEDKARLPAATAKTRKHSRKFVASQCQKGGGFVYLEDPLTPVEGVVLDLALSLYHAGVETFTAFDLLRLGEGKPGLKKSSIRYNVIKEIEGAIFHLRDIYISLVSSRPAENLAGQILPVAKKGTDVFHFRDTSGALLVWQFTDKSTLLAISEDVFKSVLEYPSELMTIGRAYKLEGIALKKYLLDRLYYCNAQKGRYKKAPRARRILFRSICQHYGQNGQRLKDYQKRHLKERVIKLIGLYATSDACPLVSFELYKSPGRNGLGFSLVFKRDLETYSKKPASINIIVRDGPGNSAPAIQAIQVETPEASAQKAREGFKIAQRERGETVEN